MNAIFVNCLSILTMVPVKEAERVGNPPGYMIGALIVVALMAYLVYTLIRPEKF